MDKSYAQTVRLLLAVAPDVFVNPNFAMKGGTAINLFVRDMPRLSVDIDVVYVPWQIEREQALQEINDELDAIANRLTKLDLHVRKIGSKDSLDTKLNIENDSSLVKIEVNTVFRGAILPIERRPLCDRAAALFAAELEVPVLSPDELYGSKFVAALDRQHPRDVFDVWQLFQTGGLNDSIVECFVTYLAGHNRPTHEVLFGNDKDIAGEYQESFVGMTSVAVSLEDLLNARLRLRAELQERLTSPQRTFLIGLANAQPNWSLLQCPYAAELPALRWKLSNLQTFARRRPADFARQAAELKTRLN